MFIINIYWVLYNKATCKAHTCFTRLSWSAYVQILKPEFQ
jgi:hypothetical protein